MLPLYRETLQDYEEVPFRPVRAYHTGYRPRPRSGFRFILPHTKYISIALPQASYELGPISLEKPIPNDL
jgi:hypothetical protein